MKGVKVIGYGLRVVTLAMMLASAGALNVIAFVMSAAMMGILLVAHKQDKD